MTQPDAKVGRRGSKLSVCEFPVTETEGDPSMSAQSRAALPFGKTCRLMPIVLFSTVENPSGKSQSASAFHSAG